MFMKVCTKLLSHRDLTCFILDIFSPFQNGPFGLIPHSDVSVREICIEPRLICGAPTH